MTIQKWILVPIDFSNDSILALKMADFEAKRWNAGLVLLYVDTRDRHGVVCPPMKKSILLKGIRFLRYTPFLNVRLVCLEGEPAEEIARMATDCEMSAIFMGYGSREGQPGRVAREVRRRFKGALELFSETMAGLVADKT